MAIEKGISVAPQGIDEAALEEETQQLEIEIVNPDMVTLDDGSVEITLIPEGSSLGSLPFEGNLAEELEEDYLAELADELTDLIDSDIDSRKEWADIYVKGLDVIGFKYEARTTPWEGACGVHSTVLAEAAIRFQAETMSETFPAAGPVRVKVLGDETKEKEEAAQRVKADMNYELTENMVEYRPEHERMLYSLGLAGSAFKKVYFDPTLGRQVAIYIPAEDVIVPYGASNIESAERVTHIMRKTKNEIRKLQANGFYRDIELGEPQTFHTDIEEKKAEDGGFSLTDDDRYSMYEIHADIVIEGVDEDEEEIAKPYVITMERGSNEILAIRRNWNPDDELMLKRQHFVHYVYVPGFGFYGLGLIHIIGGYARAGTSLIRQLVDAGTLANLPGGLKSRGLRIKGDDTPIEPGEFKDVDVPSGSIRENIMPLPYKEPSQTLFALLGFVVDAGRRFASIADNKMGEGSQANPVGTTMAIMERGTKVMNAIHKRLHHGQKLEFKLLAKVFAESLPQEYPYAVLGGNRTIKQADFDERVDILPVSDPNIFSMSQRVTLAQTQLQMATSNPEMHNMYEAYRRMYDALGVRDVDKLLQKPAQPQPEDPGMENSKALQMMKLQAFPGQAHEAHINAHRAFMSSFLVANNPPTMGVLQSHISEHISLMAREEIEAKNAPLMEEQAAQFGGQLPPELMQQFQMQNEKEIAEKITEMTNDMVAEEQDFMNRKDEDPLIDLKQQEINLRAQEIDQNRQLAEQKIQLDVAKLGFEGEKLEQKDQAEQEKLKSEEDMAMLRSETALAGKRG